MDTWNPTQYAKFQREREQPFFDLLDLVRPQPEMRVIDLGCGPGTLTTQLHQRLHARETVGLDRSARMLEGALTDPQPEGLRFEVGTIESWAPSEEYDLIFSNAAFQWVDDHESLIARLARALKPGGQLAFQVPQMYDHLSHDVAEELAAEDPFRTAFPNWRRPLQVLAPEEYARLLYRAGFAAQHVRLVIYPHVLAGPEDVVEWMKGALLTTYTERLPPEQVPSFLDEYRERLLTRLAPERPFFFPFKRILCWGQRRE